MAIEKSLQSLEGEDILTCPSCGSDKIARRYNESYCESCGFVIE